MIDGRKRHMDEVIVEIECDNDKIEALRPLALKLRVILLNRNMSFYGNMLLYIGAHKNTCFIFKHLHSSNMNY